MCVCNTSNTAQFNKWCQPGQCDWLSCGKHRYCQPSISFPLAAETDNNHYHLHQHQHQLLCRGHVQQRCHEFYNNTHHITCWLESESLQITHWQCLKLPNLSFQQCSFTTLHVTKQAERMAQMPDTLSDSLQFSDDIMHQTAFHSAVCGTFCGCSTKYVATVILGTLNWTRFLKVHWFETATNICYYTRYELMSIFTTVYRKR